MKSLKTSRFKDTIQTYSAAFRESLEKKLQEITSEYGITPLFAGLFGSRAKGYCNTKSDFDFYVPYVGAISQYVKAINVDTSQLEGRQPLPPQISFEIVEEEGVHQVQLNFVSFDHFAQELSRSNIDFRSALFNVAVFNCSTSIIGLLHDIAQTSLDLEKVKQTSLGRARKTIRILSSYEEFVPSEITDSLYRLFYAARTNSIDNAKESSQQRSPTLLGLLDDYLDQYGPDARTANVIFTMMTCIQYDNWVTRIPQMRYEIIDVFERLIPKITERPIVKFRIDSLDSSIEGRLALAAKANKAFVELLLEAHTFKTVSNTTVT